jgi:hypothetical protein
VTDEIVSLQKMQVAAWVYLVIITLGSWYIMSWSFAWAVFAGGVISILSFAVSHRDISGFFESLGQQLDDNESKKKVKKSRTCFLIRFWFRIGIIGVVLFLLIRTGEANVFGLILGLSTVVFTVTLTALRVAGRYLFRGRR